MTGASLNTSNESGWRRQAGAWLAFLLPAAGMLLLCAAAGRAGPIGLRAWLHVCLYIGIGLACLALLLLFPRRLSRGKSVMLLLVLSAVCRLFLLPHPASDDVNRYLWEGRVLAEGFSPYSLAPDSAELAGLSAGDPYHARVNHPEMTAAYPPLAVLAFGVVSRAWYDPMAVKLLVICFDIGAVCWLLALLWRRRLGARWVILYALNPVILYSFAGQAHFDAVQGFWLCGALYLYGRKRWAWMFLMAGLSVQCKYVAVLALPFLLRRENLRYAWLAAVAVVLPYVPFVSTDGADVFRSVTSFVGEFAYNGSIHGVLLGITGHIGTATAVCRVLLIAALALGYYHFHPELNPAFRNDPVSGCFFAMGAVLLLAPTVHFWYLAWIVPFLVLRPTASWLLLSFTSALGLLTIGVYHYTGEWELPLWAQILEWLPVYVMLARDAWLGWCRYRMPVDTGEATTVSVVIPVRNESMRIATCVCSVLKDPAVCEVIVVDGGSTDDSAALAADAGARVVSHLDPTEQGGGRGGQIHAGLREATGDVVAIVHADARVGAPEFTRICEVLSADPVLAGGAVGAVFDAPGIRLRLIEMANEIRMVCMGISFGDQVQFFRRRPVAEADAFPNIPLMEDVEFGLRLHRFGRQTFLFGEAMVSARRWQSSGYRRSLLVVDLVARYLCLRLFGRADARAMYEKYYG